MRKLFILLVTIALLLLGYYSVNKERGTISISINFPSAKLFMQMYGDDFENKYPKIKINVIEQETKPDSYNESLDVVFFDKIEDYRFLANKGNLVDLGPIIKEEGYQLSEFTPIVINLLQLESDKKLYGLSPSFNSYAIFFNKDLFRLYNIPFPKNKMTWNEIIELARMFPNKSSDGEKLYGFKSNYYTNIAFSMILRAGQSEGLSFIDPKTLKVNFTSPLWKPIFQSIVNAFRDGVIYDKEEDITGEIEPSPIYTGGTAMEIQSYMTAYNFESYSQFIGTSKINWDVVTAPVGSKNRSQSDYYQISEIYGISTTSEHKNEAWKLIEYITSDSQKIKANMEKNISSGLPAKIKLINSVDNHDISPLYILEPVKVSNNPYDYVDHEIINAFKEVGQSIIEEVIKKKITIDEAIPEIERLGQHAIDEMYYGFE